MLKCSINKLLDYVTENLGRGVDQDSETVIYILAPHTQSAWLTQPCILIFTSRKYASCTPSRFISRLPKKVCLPIQAQQCMPVSPASWAMKAGGLQVLSQYGQLEETQSQRGLGLHSSVAEYVLSMYLGLHSSGKTPGFQHWYRNRKQNNNNSKTFLS